jgi:hypothetical protein
VSTFYLLIIPMTMHIAQGLARMHCIKEPMPKETEERISMTIDPSRRRGGHEGDFPFLVVPSIHPWIHSVCEATDVDHSGMCCFGMVCMVCCAVVLILSSFYPTVDFMM